MFEAEVEELCTTMALLAMPLTMSAPFVG